MTIPYVFPPRALLFPTPLTDCRLITNYTVPVGTNGARNFSLTGNRLQVPGRTLEPFPVLSDLQTSAIWISIKPKVGVESSPAPHLSRDMDGKRLLWEHSPGLPHQSSVSSLSVIKRETFTPDLLIHQNGTLRDTGVVLITFWANSCWLA